MNARPGRLGRDNAGRHSYIATSAKAWETGALTVRSANCVASRMVLARSSRRFPVQRVNMDRSNHVR